MAAKAPNSPRKPRQVPQRIPGEPAPPTDNMHGEEAERVQLISIVSKLSQADIAIEAAKVPLKAAQDARKKIVGLGKAAGFTAEELKKRLDEMQNPARDNPAKFAREERHRKWLGIISPEQAEIQLGDKVPPEAKDEAHWRAEGYKAGLRQMSSTAPTECPERFVQAFMKEHERGYLETATANAPKPMKTVGDQAKADFAEDQEAEIKAGARALKESGFMNRPDERGPEDGDGIMEPLPGDQFEATEDELAAQKGRPSAIPPDGDITLDEARAEGEVV